jgi:hypothetical protein
VGGAGEALTEVAEKLSKLREHLDRVVAELNADTSRNGQLRCHECGRMGSKDAAGWTLRLCGDDELHPFCPDCDQRYFNGSGS